MLERECIQHSFNCRSVTQVHIHLEAWHIVNTTDPLADSDDDEVIDDHVRQDYSGCPTNCLNVGPRLTVMMPLQDVV